MMKNGLDSTAVGRAADQEGFGNRKLIRPSLRNETRNGDGAQERRPQAARPNGGEARPGAGAQAKKLAPPEQTHAENFYYQKQMQARTPMVVITLDGEELHGVIEWYDRTCIKLTRPAGGNLLIYKAGIKYMYKEEEK